jgi:DNA-binding transcriptional LysR family regulator
MTINQLRCFLCLVDTLSFSKTAEILYVSQSTISKQIALMEQELDAPLFERRSRHVTLTPAGKAFVGYAHKIMGTLETTIDNIQKCSVQTSAHNQLDVCFDRGFLNDVTLNTVLMEQFCSIQRENPTFNVLNHELSYAEGLEALRDHHLDIMFTCFPDFDACQVYGIGEPLNATKLGEDRVGFAIRACDVPDEDGVLSVLDQSSVFYLTADVRAVAHGMSVCKALGISPNICFFQSENQCRLILTMGKGAVFCSAMAYEYFIKPWTVGVRFFSFDIQETRCIRTAIWAEDNPNPNVAQLLTQVAQTPMADKGEA